MTRSMAVKLIGLALLLGGCAGDILVVIPPHDPNPESVLRSAAPSLVSVAVQLEPSPVARGKREAAFGVPMGNVSFSPPPDVSIRRVLEAELVASGHAIEGDSPAVELIADVKRFEVRTDTTLVYWDVIGEVAI